MAEVFHPSTGMAYPVPDADIEQWIETGWLTVPPGDSQTDDEKDQDNGE